MKTKLNITPGEWTGERTVEKCGPKPLHIEIVAGIRHIAEVRLFEDCDHANAQLIAEAGTVANETGLTPRQLADDRAELLAALERARNHLIMDIDSNGKGIQSHDSPEALQQVRAAIAKATEGKP